MPMDRGLLKCLAVILAAVLTAAVLDAQPRSLGIVQSFRGFSASYEHLMTEDCFICVDAGVLMTEVFLGTMKTPGVSADLSWNFIFFNRDLEDGGQLRAFAGPGIALGYATDFRSGHTYGMTFGICGRLGVECAFPRGLTLSAGILPALGAHLMILNDSVKMNLYRNGFLYGLMPEIGIKYNF